MNRLPGKTGPDLVKIELELGKTEPGSGKAKPESEQACEIGLWEEAKPTPVERF
jgi:hypothetical protein